ncbi:MAG: ATP-binding protein [Methanobrevibacter sp.]|jgi:predicted AAA+ superfamily ATPase|nr:ATP-binding protein [Candidatus Methanoflexus mossambicus]
MIDWKKTPAAIYRANKGELKAVQNLDPIVLDDLLNIDHQKKLILENTQRFLDGKTSSHVLLWGARGTGKSSLVKATLNHFFKSGLRLIEFFKEDLKDLIDIVDDLRDLPYKFIIFCDELSFDLEDSSYRSIKVIMDGSIELPPKNVLFYATSNRRHLVPEHFSDNAGNILENNEIHYCDSVEEKISLSDRFGLWISFYQGNLNDYLAIVDSYFPGLDDDMRSKLHLDAKNFASLRASNSGRTAKQFFYLYNDKYLK